MKHFSEKRKFRFVSLAAAAAVVGAMSMPVYAAGPGIQYSAEEMAHLEDNTLEWYEINDLINLYNTNVLKNRNDLSKDERKSYNAQEVSNYLLDQADEADRNADAMGDSNAILAASLRNSANSMRMQAESNVSDYEILKMEFDVLQRQTAASAQKSFLGYHSALIKKGYEDANVAYMEKVYNSTMNKRNVGMATDVDVLTAKENFDKARADILTNSSALESNRIGLLVMCGWKFDSDGVIAELPELDMNQIAAIQYEADLNTAKENNLGLKMSAKKLENAKSGNYTPDIVEQNQNQYNSDLNTFGINFKATYDALMNAVTTYNNSINDKNVGAANLTAAERQLGLGMISQIDYEGIVNRQKSLEMAEKNAYIALIQAKATYDAAVGGLL